MESDMIRLVLAGVGLMVGAGIYSLIGKVVEDVGDYAPRAFMIATFVMTLNAYPLSKIVSRFGNDDNVLKTIKRAFGNSGAVAFEILRLVEGIIVVSVTVKLSVMFFHTIILGAGDPPVWWIFAELIFFSAVISRGLQTALDLGNVGTFIEVSGLVLVIGGGLVFTLTGVEHVVSEAPSDLPSQLNSEGMSDAIIKILFAFGGIQQIMDLAGDVRDANVILPRVIMISAISTGLMYSLVSAAALRMVGVSGLQNGSINPLGHVLESVGFPWGTDLSLTAIAFVSVTNTSLTVFLVVSRILLGLSNHITKSENERQARLTKIYGTIILVCGTICWRFDVFKLANAASVTLLLKLALFNFVFLKNYAVGGLERGIGGLAMFVSMCVVFVYLWN